MTATAWLYMGLLVLAIALIGAAGAVRSRLRPVLALGGVVLLAALFMGCGTLAQIRLGGETLTHPDQDVVRSHVCAGNDDAARLYLNDPSYAWLGPARERYITDARDAKLAGKCPCHVDVCK
jgi:hypothetical protein